MADSGDANHRRRVLEGVPRVGFYPDMRGHKDCRGPEDFIFPSCMRAVMEYVGHPEYDYTHFMGVTGAGFFLNWKPGWHGDNVAIYYMAPLAEHVRLFEYAFDSTGYAMEFAMLKGEEAIDEAEAKRRIRASIDAGRPVLSHGIVGPPETSIICGYDEGGDVLIGWSFFQTHEDRIEGVEFEPNGMFRRRNWLSDAWDLTWPGERGGPVQGKALLRRTLGWALKVARTPVTWGDRHNGLAAYDAWAEHLTHDDEIAACAEEPAPGADGKRSDWPFGVHDDAVGTVAEGRWYAGRYLASVAGVEPKMAADLYEAAACCAREHELMWQVWGCAGGNGRSPEHARRFAEPETRRKMVPLIQEAKRQDEKAISLIEAALAVM